MRYNSKIRELERKYDRLKKYPANEFSDVLELIAQGAYYDDLTEEEKDKYCLYHNVPDRKAFEEVQIMVLEDENALHFQLEYKPKPLTDEEFRERVEWVEQMMTEIEEEYNSPESVAKREAQYQGMKQISYLRRNARLRGLDEDTYPLPVDVYCGNYPLEECKNLPYWQEGWREDD